MSGPQDPDEPQYPQDPSYPPPSGPYPRQPTPPPAGQPYGTPPQGPTGGPQYGQQQYPGQPYPGQQYPTQQFPAQGAYPPPQPPGHAAGPRPGLWQRLGARATHRPAPRFGVTLTGVGVLLVVLGILVWGITYIVEGVTSGLFNGGGAGSSDSRRFLGFALALILVAIGYALVVVARSGPLVTAGIAASALGIPVAMEFATLDLSGGSAGNSDAVVWVSIVAYLISYLFVRGARGHTFYLGLAALLLWEYAVGKAGPSSQAVGSAFVGSATGTPTSTSGFGPSFDYKSVAAVSLVFAIGYYLIAWFLDHTGRRGVALPFVVVGIPAMVLGIGALAPDTKQIGTGILLLVIGLVLSRYGARYERRFTAWFWGVLAAGGAVAILTKFATQGTSVGIGMIVIGAVFAVGGWFAAKALREPDDMVSGALNSGPNEGPVTRT